MSFNVQSADIEGSLCLLEWINSQRLEKGLRGHLISFQKVLEEGSIYQILSAVDSTLFESIQYYSKAKKIEALEKYLDRQFGKRMRWSFKQSLGEFNQQSNIKQLAKLICYLGVHSSKKNDFISRILKLTENTQNYLMNQMQILQKKLQNIMEIKEILEQIQLLEEENEELKQKLQQMAKANSDLLALIKDTESENKNIKQQVKKYREQKCEVLTALKIDHISEYLDMYNRLSKQNEANLDNLRQVQIKLENNQIYSKQLHERIKADCLVINSLNDEVSRLKQLCSENSARWSFDNVLGVSNSNLLKSASSNKQNINKSKCSTTIGKSLDVPYNSSEWTALTDNEEQLNERQSVRVHNQELMGKLQEMYKKYNKLNSQAGQLRQKNQKLGKNYLKIRDVLKAVENAQSEFEFKYKAASNQHRIAINGGASTWHD